MSLAISWRAPLPRVLPLTALTGRILSAMMVPVVALMTVAGADERPLTLPSRDVDVVYQMSRPDGEGGTRTMLQRMRWAAGSTMLRVDPPTPGMYMVMDYQNHRLWAVRDRQRSVMEIESAGIGMTPGLSHATDFSRGDEAQVAGLSCTEWTTRDSSGVLATVCLTADGVLLRARRGEQVMVEASRVTYGPIGAEVFRIPPDYRTVRAPMRSTPSGPADPAPPARPTAR